MLFFAAADDPDFDDEASFDEVFDEEAASDAFTEAEVTWSE